MLFVHFFVLQLSSILHKSAGNNDSQQLDERKASRKEFLCEKKISPKINVQEVQSFQKAAMKVDLILEALVRVKY